MAHTASREPGWHDPHGRGARSPREIPRRGWRDILLRLKDRIRQDRLSIIAAGVAFYGLLAVFPALAALVSLFGLLASPAQIEAQLAELARVLPPQAAEILLQQLHELAQTDTTALGVGAFGGILLALWSASSGVRTLMEALNVTYGEEEKRGFFRFYGTALLLTLAAIAGALLSIGIVIALPLVIDYLGLGAVLHGAVSFARWPILAVMMLVGLAIVYRYGPDRTEPRWAWVSPGAITATVLWLIGSALFSLYVTRFADYNATYGSMGAVVILLLWFLLSAYAVLLGAEINAEMERQTRRDTTEGDEKPQGRRGARAADTLGESR